MVHVRSHDGRLLDFGTSGSLWNDALVMYDRQTESYWSHVLGLALEGPLEGAQLRMIPSTVTSYAEWVEAHPATLVLEKQAGEGRATHYDKYASSDRQGIFGTQAQRKALAPKAVVQGTAIGRDAVAIPHDALPDGGMVDFKIGSQSFTAVRSGSEIQVFSRMAADRMLRLEPVVATPGRMRDRETGTLWDTRTGEGLKGPLADYVLTEQPSTTVFWFAWINFYPRARIAKP